MDTLPSSNNCKNRTHHMNKNGSSDGVSCVECDEEGGEPPNISCVFSEKTAIMTRVGSTPSSSGRSVSRRGLNDARYSSRFAIIMLLLWNSFCMQLCTAAEGIPNVSEEKTVHGVRGALAITTPISHQSINVHDMDMHANCNYECCFDLMVTQFGDEQTILQNKQSASVPGIRMLQESASNSAAAAAAAAVTAPVPCTTEENGDGIGLPIGVQYFLIVVLVAFSALFSGLTLGLMSLDPSGLEIVMANSDDPNLARAAKAIYPVRLNGNLLLCTLLLGNVGVNSMLSIFMADLTSGLVGFIVSTAVIVIFGEIIPQALCSRFALQVGEKTVPLVKVIMFLLYPLCKPMSMVLNKVLGHEVGTQYSSSEMAKLIEMHVARGELEGATGAAMTGALRYRSAPVTEVMTPLVNTFMLSADERLGFDTVAKIFKTGYSRIPVYEVSQSNIIGLLFVKDLIFLDPEDEIPVKNFVQIFGRGLHIVWADDKLGGVLKLLKSGRSHMALVRDVNDGGGKVDPYYEIKGIITLEDIIEMILGDEIVDETDELIDVNDPDSAVERSDMGEYIVGDIDNSTGRESPALVGGGVSDRYSTRTIDWEARLRLLDERLVDEHLAPEEVRAVAAHLKTNYSKAVELISDRQLKELLSLVPVTEVFPASTCSTEDGGDDGSGVPTDSAELIYERGVPADFCTVVLSGKIMVMSGADKFRSDVSNWGVLASRALTDPGYVPDFSAWVLPNQNSTGGCRCVKLDRKSYCDAVDNTAVERTDHNITRPAPLAMSAVITNKAPLSPNVDASEIAAAHTVPLATAVTSSSSLNKASSTDQIDAQPPVTPGQTLEDEVQIDHTTPTYVKTPAYVQPAGQKQKHSRRSQLLKAFTRATKKAEEKK